MKNEYGENESTIDASDPTERSTQSKGARSSPRKLFARPVRAVLAMTAVRPLMRLMAETAVDEELRSWRCCWRCGVIRKVVMSLPPKCYL